MAADSKSAIAERLTNALRRSSAVGTLHGQAIAKKARMNASDLEALDIVVMSGGLSAGELGRRTGLTSGSVTALIGRLTKLGFVERVADPDDLRKVTVRARLDRIQRLAQYYGPLEKAMGQLLAGYSKEELALIAEFTEKSAALVLKRTAELSSGK